MKIRTILAALIVVVLTLSACSGIKKNNDDPAQLFKDAVANSEVLESKNLEMTVKVEGGSSEMSMTSDMKINLKIAIENKDLSTLSLLANATVKISGLGVDVGVYVKDGMMYTNVLGMKTKTKIDQTSQDNPFAQFNGLTGSVFNGFDVSKAAIEKQGKATVYTFTFSTLEEVKQFYDNLGLLSTLTNSSDSTFDSLQDASASVVVSVENSYLTSITVTMNSLVKGESVPVVTALGINVIDPGKSVTISAPTDLDSYTESNPQD